MGPRVSCLPYQNGCPWSRISLRRPWTVRPFIFGRYQLELVQAIVVDALLTMRGSCVALFSHRTSFGCHHHLGFPKRAAHIPPFRLPIPSEFLILFCVFAILSERFADLPFSPI